MRIVLLGAIGFAGSALLSEALSPGHETIPIVRRPEKLGSRKNLTVKAGDAHDVDALEGPFRNAKADQPSAGPVHRQNTCPALPGTPKRQAGLRRTRSWRNGTSGRPGCRTSGGPTGLR